MHIFRIIKLIYAALLRLYPYRFQTEFRDEMQAVFAATISDAARAGVMSAIVACLRELRDLPMNLLREHWLNYEEAFMSNFHFSSDPRRSALWGALGFGVAFALAKTISVGWLSASVILYALAGAIGGALFCVAGESRKHIRLFASIGALAFGIGHLVASLMTITVASVVSGIVGGAVLGLSIGSGHQGIDDSLHPLT